VRILLISTYELGRQPFGLASPAAWLRAEGHQVTQVDVSRMMLPAVRETDLVAFFLPMHTATRIALPLIEKIRATSQAHLCAYGLYAALNQELLRRAGVESIIGGEFEQPLVDLCRRLSGPAENGSAENGSAENPGLTSLARQQFQVPDRTGLPPLAQYTRLVIHGERRLAGYTEASRGCKHLCRHCPVVPVYQGAFRIVQREIVLEDIRRQVAGGARHITFGDPDFFNGPGHAIPIIEALHQQWPFLTYDVTIKIEHLVRHRALLPKLRTTGCLFITSAVESLEDAVLDKLAKGHTRRDFLVALGLVKEAGLLLSPTFIPFTPWTTLESYRSFLRELSELALSAQVAPVQLAIRLLIPEGSLLLELPEIRSRLEEFDPRALSYRWRSEDPAVDKLQRRLEQLIPREERRQRTREEIFQSVSHVAGTGSVSCDQPRAARVTIPYLTEPWYC